MQEIKFVQTQQTANDPIWAPIKGKKILQLNSCHGRTGVITDEKQPDPNKKKTSYSEGTEDREGHNKHIGTSIPLAWAKADL